MQLEDFNREEQAPGEDWDLATDIFNASAFSTWFDVEDGEYEQATGAHKLFDERGNCIVILLDRDPVYFTFHQMESIKGQ